MRGKDTTFVFNLESPQIIALCAADKQLAGVIRGYGELEYSLHAEVFSFFIETIVGQMLSNKVAEAITARLYAACGGKLTPAAILKLDTATLRSIGLSGAKVGYIQQMAALIHDDPSYFDGFTDLPDAEVIKRVTSLRGIGMWSAKMYLIFVLNRFDVLPYEDGAFLQAYKWLYETDDIKPVSIIQRCAPWKPYSSLAARYLYRALDSGMTKSA